MDGISFEFLSAPACSDKSLFGKVVGASVVEPISLEKFPVVFVVVIGEPVSFEIFLSCS